MRPPRPPAAWTRVLELLLPRASREFAMGDLEEEFRARHAADGPSAARRWYRSEARRAAAAFLRRPLGRTKGPVGTGRASVVEASGRDLRFATRSLIRRPGQSLLIAVVLSVAVGASTAVFTIVDRVLLRGLPYESSHEIVDVWNTYPSWRGHHVLDRLWDRIGLSWPEYQRWRDAQTAFREVAAYTQETMALTGTGEPVGVTVSRATPSLWPLLGISPAAGRLFGPDESGSGAAAVAVLAHPLWRDRFGADPGILGETVRLDGRPFEVIGVLPPAFRFAGVAPGGGEIQAWLPAGGEEVDRHEGNHVFEGIARLGPGGLGPDEIEETRRLVSGGASPEARGIRIVSRHAERVENAREPLILLLAAVGLLMTLACVNVAALLLGRAAARRGELATRATLGAGAGRLLRQLLAEGALIGALGIAGGIAVAFAALRVLVANAPAELGIPTDLALDHRVLAFAVGLGILTSLVFGMLPALMLRRLDLQGELRRAPGRTSTGGWRSQRALVAAQFAISFVLLVGTGLLTRSLIAELGVDPGFDAAGTLTVDVQLPDDRYPGAESRSAFLSRAVDRIEALPGVIRVSGSTGLPFSGRGGSSSFDIAGEEVGEDEKKPEAARRSVLPGFHEALGIPILRGRTFDRRDVDGAPPVAVVSESMDALFWPDRSALGRAIVRDARRWEIVGVVGDILMSDLTGSPDATFYTPLHQEEAPTRSFASLIVEAEGDPGALAHAVRSAIWEIDPALPLDRVEPLASVVRRSTAGQRYRAALVSVFGAIAALLAGIGVLGVTGRSLLSRMRELGIRVALGAEPRRLLAREVLREAVPLGVGIAIGLAIALAGSRFAGSLLFGVTALDPISYLAATLGLAAIGLGAAAAAARRVTRLDPAEVLRAD